MNTAALDLQPLRGAISSVDDGFTVLNGGAWAEEPAGVVFNTLRAGVIQSFEYTYSDPAQIDLSGDRRLAILAILDHYARTKIVLREARSSATSTS